MLLLLFFIIIPPAFSQEISVKSDTLRKDALSDRGSTKAWQIP
jgi:hypothetical protein